jgi:hypothetical protein
MHSVCAISHGRWSRCSKPLYHPMLPTLCGYNTPKVLMVKGGFEIRRNVVHCRFWTPRCQNVMIIDVGTIPKSPRQHGGVCQGFACLWNLWVHMMIFLRTKRRRWRWVPSPRNMSKPDPSHLRHIRTRGSRYSGLWRWKCTAQKFTEPSLVLHCMFDSYAGRRTNLSLARSNVETSRLELERSKLNLRSDEWTFCSGETELTVHHWRLPPREDSDIVVVVQQFNVIGEHWCVAKPKKMHTEWSLWYR